eukprot:g35391.t1
MACFGHLLLGLSPGWFAFIAGNFSTEEVDKMSKKMEEVKEANVRVVSEDLLDDLQSGKGLQELLSVHGISSWGAELAPEKVSEPPVAGKSTGSKVTKNSSGKIKQEQESSKSEKKMKLTVKGGAAVDPDSGLEDSAHVFEQGGRILSATLGLVDISRSQNSYYKLQLLEDDNKKRFTAPRVKGVSGIKGTGPRVEGVVLVFGGGGQGDIIRSYCRDSLVNITAFLMKGLGPKRQPSCSYDAAW